MTPLVAAVIVHESATAGTPNVMISAPDTTATALQCYLAGGIEIPGTGGSDLSIGVAVKRQTM